MKKNKGTELIKNFVTFIGFSVEKIDAFYNKKYQKYLYEKSHEKEFLESNSKESQLRKHDLEGNIINAKFSCTTTDGIPITEKDFIKEEISKLENINIEYLDFDKKKRIEFYKNYLNKKLTENKESNISLARIEFDANLWNKEAFNLFNYLLENYYDGKTKRKLTNIWFYLEYDTPEKYLFRASKDKYKEIIEKRLSVNLTNKDKPQNYEANAKLIIDDHRRNFENSLK